MFGSSGQRPAALGAGVQEGKEEAFRQLDVLYFPGMPFDVVIWMANWRSQLVRGQIATWCRGSHTVVLLGLGGFNTEIKDSVMAPTQPHLTRMIVDSLDELTTRVIGVNSFSFLGGLNRLPASHPYLKQLAAWQGPLGQHIVAGGMAEQLAFYRDQIIKVIKFANQEREFEEQFGSVLSEEAVMKLIQRATDETRRIGGDASLVVRGLQGFVAGCVTKLEGREAHETNAQRVRERVLPLLTKLEQTPVEVADLLQLGAVARYVFGLGTADPAPEVLQLVKLIVTEKNELRLVPNANSLALYTLDGIDPEPLLAKIALGLLACSVSS